EILEGIDGLPPIQGFVMTSLKESGLVEVPVRSPFPSDQKNSTLLATWNYGAGRTVAWTTDAGHRWATEWTSWPQYDKFFSQLVRWSMRPTGDTGNFSITTTMQDDKVQLVVDALDKNDEFLNFLDLSGSVVDPLMETQDIELRQTSPGRYIAEFPADRAGCYFLTLNPGGERAALRTGINVPYSPEFRDRETNETFLTSLARLEPTGGEPGVVIDGNLGAENVESLLATDTFRRSLTRAVSINYVWPWLLLIACCVFLADIFVRRVAVSFAWLPPLLASAQRYVTGKEKEVVSDKRMERLRSRKHQVTDEIDRQRAATRFEPEPDRAVNEDVLDEGATLTSDQAKRAPRTARPESAEPEDQDTYTARLLKAKQEARRKSRGDSS
ncbi:MAG: hypothetical protein KDA60_14810, partial [Planctomycetales bacterium]|nr:hypothetical protein [Planctomycetales bacterium]